VKQLGGSRRVIVTLGFLVLVHLALMPFLLNIGENTTLFVANLAACIYGLLYVRWFSTLRFAGYIVGYSVFIMLIALFPSSTPLISLFILLYVSLFRLPRLLFHFLLFVVCVEVVPEYFAQLYPVAALLLELAHHCFVKLEESLLGWSYLIGFVLLGGILVPVFGLALGTSPQTLAVTARDGQVVAALGTSLLTATITTIISLLFGVPLAYALARTKFWGREIVTNLIDLPILIPQSIAGLAILATIGPKTTFGRLVEQGFGLKVSGAITGIVLAQLFVSAPFLIRSALSAFLEVDKRLEHVSRSLGASPLRTFRSISLPLALPGILAGCVLTWSRAISEAGAVMLIAYHPFTISTLVNDRFNQFGTEEAAPIAALLVIVCLFIFLALHLSRYIRFGPFRREVRHGRS